MRYYLILKHPDGSEDATACYDTADQAREWARKQAENWHDQDGKWIVRVTEQLTGTGGEEIAVEDF